MSAGRMVFYAPRPIEGASIGSLVRIHALLAAFRALGFEVEEVTGRIGERLPHMRRIMRRLAADGAAYDFLYAENATIPLHLGEPRGLLVRRHPLADARFLAACRRHGVPIGVFYRDAWWRFDTYRESTPAPRRWIRRPFYWLELLLYARFADILYVPHRAMAAALPIRFRRIDALPPGVPGVPGVRHRLAPGAPASLPPDRELRIFYVGGVGPFYRLDTLLAAVRRVDGVRLTICCRPQDWQRSRDGYRDLLCDRVEIVHAHGPALLPFFEAADVLSCFLAPNPYWRVTLPIKLFEYLGHGKPILAARDTNAGQFVAEHGVGWAVADDVAELAALLRRLRAQPDELAAKAANAVRVVPEHTWEARARQVAADLRALRRSPPPAGAAVVGERVPRPAGGRPEPRRRTRPGMTGAGTGWTRDS